MEALITNIAHYAYSYVHKSFFVDGYNADSTALSVERSIPCHVLKPLHFPGTKISLRGQTPILTSVEQSHTHEYKRIVIVLPNVPCPVYPQNIYKKKKREKKSTSL